MEQELKIRVIFKAEARKNAESVAMGSFFVNGSYAYYQSDFVANAAVEVVFF
jgi:hypothetical protein